MFKSHCFHFSAHLKPSRSIHSTCPEETTLAMAIAHPTPTTKQQHNPHTDLTNPARLAVRYHKSWREKKGYPNFTRQMDSAVVLS